MRGFLRALLAIMLAVVVLITPTSATAGEIQDGKEGFASTCGIFWPTTGKFEAIHLPGTQQYTTTLRFTLTQSEVNALRCVGEYLEIDFTPYGLDLPSQWEGYSVESNLPGAIHDVAASDFNWWPGKRQTPGITRIYTEELRADYQYTATLRWNEVALNPNDGAPGIYISWIPSQWAQTADRKLLCETMTLPPTSSQDEAWCIFGKTAVRLSGDLFQDQFPSGMIPFDGIRILEYSPQGVTQSSGVIQQNPVAPTPPPVGSPHPGFGPKIASLAFQDGRLAVFYVGPDNAVKYRLQDAPGGQWSGPEYSIPAHVKAVAVAASADSRVEVFGIGADNAVWHWWQTSPNSHSWDGPERFAANVISIAAARNGQGKMEVYGVGADHANYVMAQSSPNSWAGSNWQHLPAFSWETAAVASHDGRNEIFYVGSDNAMWHRWQPRRVAHGRQKNASPPPSARSLPAETPTAGLSCSWLAATTRSGICGKLAEMGGVQPTASLQLG